MKTQWCFKYDTSTHELLVEQVRCPDHSVGCTLEGCKDRWYDGMPGANTWLVERKDDGTVDTRKVRCGKHSSKCSVEGCTNRWCEGMSSANTWSVQRKVDDTVDAEKLRCPQHT